jgi:trigger factor
MSDKQTLAELREQIRSDQQQQAEYQADQGVRDRLMDQLVEAHDFPVPDVMIEQQAAELSRRYLSTLMQLRVPVEEIKQINWEERAKQDRQRAVRDVRGALVVGRIAEAENITVTKEEMEAEITRMAASLRQSPEDLKAALTKDDALSSIENRLLYQKTLDFVVSQSEVTVEEFTDAQLEDQTDNQESAQASGEATQA